MTLASDLVNNNGISAFALAFFTALFGTIGAVSLQIYQVKNKLLDAKEAVDVTAVFNSRAGERLERKIDLLATNDDRLEQTVDDIGTALRNHIEWHLTEKRK
jgi:hypothetical protein